VISTGVGKIKVAEEGFAGMSKLPPKKTLPRWIKTSTPLAIPTKGCGKLRTPAAVPDVLRPWEFISGKVWAIRSVGLM
jgi:hypothetical protein